jgi:hypothetical protein
MHCSFKCSFVDVMIHVVSSNFKGDPFDFVTNVYVENAITFTIA